MPILAFTGSLTRSAPNYAGARGRGIASYRFDAAAGQLAPIAEFSAIDDANWLEIDVPRRRLYAACEAEGTDRSWVTEFGIGVDGRLTELGRQPTGGQTICHMSFSPDRRFLAIANYNAAVPEGAPDGAVDVFPIAADGTLGTAVASARHVGTGPNPRRQERSHAHCTVFSPDGRFLYVADLGTDRIVVYGFGRDGSLTAMPALDFIAAPGLGPRHLAFGADGKSLFMVSELIATVLSLAVDPSTGGMTLRDSFAIPPSNGPIVQPAGILLGPDGRHVFAQLRQCNEILGLAVDAATGKLSQTGRWPSGGATPRDFSFSPDGKYLVVCNQDGDRVTTFPVHGGMLEAPVQNLATGTPMAIKLAVFPAA